MKYLLAKIVYVLCGRDMKVLLDFFRKSGMKVGEGCMIYSNIVTSESYLIDIGKNTTISNDVQLVTHDNSISKIDKNFTDTFGEIYIGENCFIGAKTIILPGVSLASNCIVGAGSVVTKSFFEEESILGGNPARVVGSVYRNYEKKAKCGFNINGLSVKEKHDLIYKEKDKLVSR